MSKSGLFMRLLAAGTEDEVQGILDAEGLTTDATKWTPYGDNESFYGVVAMFNMAHKAGIWQVGAGALWAMLFLERRRWRMSPLQPTGQIRSVLDEICRRLLTELRSC
jgi:hypothetical protein